MPEPRTGTLNTSADASRRSPLRHPRIDCHSISPSGPCACKSPISTDRSRTTSGCWDSASSSASRTRRRWRRVMATAHRAPRATGSLTSPPPRAARALPLRPAGPRPRLPRPAHLAPERAGRVRRHGGPPRERGALPDDPDGLGIEVYADRPRSTWRVEGGSLAMATDPLDLDALVAAGGGATWSGMPESTRVGHIHLYVDDLDRAGDSTTRGLGSTASCSVFRAPSSSRPADTTITWGPIPGPPARRRPPTPTRASSSGPCVCRSGPTSRRPPSRSIPPATRCVATVRMLLRPIPGAAP